MPYTMHKLKSGKVEVDSPHGVKSYGSTPANAKKQVHLLEGVDHGWKPTGANHNAFAKRIGAACLLLLSLWSVISAHAQTVTPGQTKTAESMAVVYMDANGNVVYPSSNGTSSTVGIDQSLPGNSNGVQVNAALPPGTNTIGTVNPGNTPNTVPWLVQAVPGTTNGTSTCFLSSAATTNATNCKNATGSVYLIRSVNTTATIYFLRMYDSSTTPTCSSATGFKETIPIPASTSGAGIVIPQVMGQAYVNGVSFCLTGGGSSTDNTNAATGIYVTLLFQ